MSEKKVLQFPISKEPPVKNGERLQPADRTNRKLLVEHDIESYRQVMETKNEEQMDAARLEELRAKEYGELHQMASQGLLSTDDIENLGRDNMLTSCLLEAREMYLRLQMAKHEKEQLEKENKRLEAEIKKLEGNENESAGYKI